MAMLSRGSSASRAQEIIVEMLVQHGSSTLKPLSVTPHPLQAKQPRSGMLWGGEGRKQFWGSKMLSCLELAAVL